MQNKYNIKIAECCLNCKHRDCRIDNNVICNIHKDKLGNRLWVNQRMICDKYEKTESKNLIISEETLMKIIIDN